ncbi:activator of 90 kDa heat shock protein ATPase homolog 2-like [Cynocephalus volans]|uniref:activator of 90 kDa heat shock protein ATPase homolog 2-like n=1 Tax=Cynocephalus volans TaxID=110931 RepID=UPI002FCAB66B
MRLQSPRCVICRGLLHEENANIPEVTANLVARAAPSGVGKARDVAPRENPARRLCTAFRENLNVPSAEDSERAKGRRAATSCRQRQPGPRAPPSPAASRRWREGLRPQRRVLEPRLGHSRPRTGEARSGARGRRPRPPGTRSAGAGPGAGISGTFWELPARGARARRLETPATETQPQPPFPGLRRGRAARAATAKWGHGDPRWIVEEREDATNVNNWHWTERDVTNWSKDKLRELLVGIVVENESGRCEISELKQVEGEASCSSRKGKLIFFYEWNIKLGWKGTIKGSGGKHKGLIEIPNLSEENEVDDTEASSPVALGVRIPTVALHTTGLFDTSVEQLYSIFTVRDLVQEFFKSPAVLEAEKGGKFQMFHGNITGEYIDLLTNKKIVMKWRCRNWPEEHYATVALNFVPTLGQTEL